MRVPVYVVYRAVYKIIHALLWCGLLGLAFPALATHQVGGHIEMRFLGNSPGQYKIIVTNYLENNARGLAQGGGQLGIFRKRDNALMTTFLVSEVGQRKPIVYANEKCAELRNLNFLVATFEATLNLNPATYNDPGGYYISYQTRNRNAAINNIIGPANTGYTFYLEFPPLITPDGKFIINGSPRFNDINGEYICMNDPFTYAFGGTDPDGDELRYSMVTPLNQSGPATGGGNANFVGPGPYPDVSWVSGFSLNNQIPGNPALSINSRTGELNVTATQQGLFVFAVRVEEFRNGVKIGEVRRDFQLLVVDCPPATVPKAVVQAKDQPAKASSFTICPTNFITLLANTNPTWNYQWQRDGFNLAGDTLPTLKADLPGSYEVIVSLKSSCVKASRSQSMSLTVFEIDANISSSGHLCPTTGTVSLSVTDNPDQTYRWLINNQVQANKTAPTISTQQPGRFQAEITNTQFGCLLLSDPWTIERSAPVQASLSSSQSAICPGATLTLRAEGGASYIWQLNKQLIPETGAVFVAKTAGTYSLTAIDSDGCEGVASPLPIGQIPAIKVTMEPVLPVCSTANPSVSLRGLPAGGVGTTGEFGGEGSAAAGVVNGRFSPAVVGLGDHVLTYTVRPALWCEGVVARQTAVVAPIPTIMLPDTVKTWWGNSFTLDPILTGNPNQFWWSPTVFLANENTAIAEVDNITKDTTYYFRVMNSVGCQARDTVKVLVFTRIWAPDAFTPNNDRQNDVWELKGVEGFTLAEVTIFNRWGEIVYWSNDGYKTPFDGTFKGESLPSGNYVYVLKPAPGYQTLRGRLVLMR
jgi:gliding motility-associated-like protein